MKRGKKSIVLVFGENANDRDSIRELIRALRPDAPSVEGRQKPLILMRDKNKAEQRANAATVLKILAAESVRHNVVAIAAHQDCDNVEPAHLKLEKEISDTFAEAGVAAIPVAPAFEMEAWWYLWPDAVAQ